MKGYATVFSRWISAGNRHLEDVLDRGLNPEIGLQYEGYNLPAALHREAAAKIRDKGLGCAIHLPYEGVRPGAAEEARQEQSRDILLKALEVAAIYEPDHLIGHPEFRPGMDSASNVRGPQSPMAAETLPRQDSAGRADNPMAAEGKNRPGEIWLRNSARIWGEVLKLTPARLYLENTSDADPTAIMALLDQLPPQAGLCFDIGHWHYAADGVILRDLPKWIEAVAPRLGHLHLHDNNGTADQHLGLGLGGIDLDEFMNLLAARGLAPTFTLEAHTIDNLNQSLNWLKKAGPGVPLK